MCSFSNRISLTLFLLDVFSKYFGIRTFFFPAANRNVFVEQTPFKGLKCQNSYLGTDSIGHCSVNSCKLREIFISRLCRKYVTLDLQWWNFTCSCRWKSILFYDGDQLFTLSLQGFFCSSVRQGLWLPSYSSIQTLCLLQWTCSVSLDVLGFSELC